MSKLRKYYVYIMANDRPTLYTGMTSRLIHRVYQHKNELIEGFTKKYKLKKLVYYEAHRDPKEAIRREKRIKKWNRQWKLDLIKEENPNLKDLYPQLMADSPIKSGNDDNYGDIDGQ